MDRLVVGCRFNASLQMSWKKTLNNRAIGRSACLLALLGFLLILGVGLYPYRFAQGISADTVVQFFFLTKGAENDWEVVLNVLLFIPFAFGLALYRGQKSGTLIRNLFFVFIATAVLSYTIEFLQFFLSGRFPSRLDLFGNCLGGLLGFMMSYVIIKRSAPAIIFAYLVIVFLVSIFLQRTATFINWDNSFPLLVNNERTGDRPWNGAVHEFFIADKAVGEPEIKAMAAENNPYPILGSSLISFYKFQSPDRYHDENRLLPDIILKDAGQSTPQGGQASLQQSNARFESQDGVSPMVKRLVHSSQFTLGVLLTSYSDNQYGPARIVSLSGDTGRRNFTLGQEGKDLIFRLRTPSTGLNGANPALRVPAVFATTGIKSIVITYNGTDLLVFVNGLLRRESLSLTPGAVAFGFFWSSIRHVQKIFDILYYGLLFLPMGALLSFIPKRSAVAVGSAVLPPLFFELILVAVSGREPNLSNVLIGFIFTLLGMLVFRRLNLSYLRATFALR